MQAELFLGGFIEVKEPPFSVGSCFVVKYYKNILHAKIIRESEKAVLLECEPYKFNSPFTFWVAKKYILNRVIAFQDQTEEILYEFNYDISQIPGAC